MELAGVFKSSCSVIMWANTVFCGTIDDVQQKDFHYIIEQIFGEDSILGTIVIRNNPSGRPIPTGFAIAHEYAIFASFSKNVKIDKLPREEKHNLRYKEKDEKGNYMWELLRKRGSNSRREDAPKSYFPFFVKNGYIRLPKMKWDDERNFWKVEETPSLDEISVYPVDENNVQRNWRWGIETAIANVKELKCVIKNGNPIIYYKFYSPEGITPTTNWIESKYSATEHGTGIVKHFFERYQPFSYPKSIFAVMDCVEVSGIKNLENGICLDFFAGSGTTAHAVLSLNKEDQGSRKYILVEMAEYFDTVMKPRIQKVCYSLNWKDGSPQDTDGQSHIFKYFSLESYEDSLNNITFDTSVQKTLMDLEGYFLNYVLDFETRDSPCRLTVENLKHPFDYQLKVIRDNSEQTVKVDLPETFAYLIGLHVKIRRAFSHPDIGRYLVYHGTTREGTVTVIWRNCEQIDLTKDKDFVMKTILTDIPKAETLYLNGEFIIPGAHGLDRVFKERMGA
jgi:adenine-specific DNA-methyltransferase